jgi:hypothetical protein
VPGSSAPALEEDQVSATAVIEQDHCYLRTPNLQVQDSLELDQLPQTDQSTQVQEKTTVTEDDEETVTAPEDDDDEVTRDYSELLRYLGGQPSGNLQEVNVADVERFCKEFPSKSDPLPQDSTENSKPQDPGQQDISTSWPSCPVLLVLSWLSCPGCPGLLVLSCFPVLVVLSFFSCPGCSVLFVLSWLSCPGCCPFLLVQSWLSCPGCPVLVVLSWLSCPGCPVLLVLS